MPIKLPLTNRQIKSLIIALIIALTGGATYVSNTSKTPFKKVSKNIPSIEVNKQYEVIKVVDGDTFNIKVEDQTVKVRMLGVDTPETVDTRKTVQCFGIEASNKVKELLSKRTVTLETDPTQGIEDKYDRLLAYVYRDDGLPINEYLLENGYAYEYTYNVPYSKQDKFKQLARSARENKVGLWGDLCNGLK
jgi:micrococcal nuclease